MGLFDKDSFNKALKRATFMTMMDEEEEKKKKRKRDFENFANDPEETLADVGLSYKKLKKMDEDEREALLFDKGLEPSDFDFD